MEHHKIVVFGSKQDSSHLARRGMVFLAGWHYGFTHEELDFIINYDIKYRMGKELSGSGEEE